MMILLRTQPRNGLLDSFTTGCTNESGNIYGLPERILNIFGIRDASAGRFGFDYAKNSTFDVYDSPRYLDRAQKDSQRWLIVDF